MATVKTPFLGAFYVARSSNQADEQCVNLFLELDEEKQGKAPGMLLQAPGMDLLVTLLPQSSLLS